jgi:MFS family permease
VSRPHRAPPAPEAHGEAGLRSRSATADGDPLARYRGDVARHYRRNLTLHLLYGLFGTTGWRLIMAPTFVPDYVYRLGGSQLVVGALLSCGGLARFVSPLIGAARLVDRPLVKPATLRIGAVMRVQVLGMALAALALPIELNLIAFAALYVVFSVFNGLQGVAYGLLTAKVIPLARRGRFIGLRDFAGGATAAIVSAAAAGFFARSAFPLGHGLTYLAAFLFTALGLVCLSGIREPVAPFAAPPRSLAATLAATRTLVAGDRAFAWFCVARGLAALGLMAAPYFIIAVGGRIAGGAAGLAHASVAYFTAQTAANLLWGPLADRAGFRTVFLVAAVVWLGALGLAAGVTTLPGALLLFVLIGVGQGGLQMASMNLVYEFGDDGQLALRIGAVNALGELMTAVAPLTGGWIADRWSHQALYGVAAAMTVAAIVAMHRGVPAAPRRLGAHA